MNENETPFYLAETVGGSCRTDCAKVEKRQELAISVTGHLEDATS
jgi:hypothetical protein